jgi:putative transcriptional regulator
VRTPCGAALTLAALALAVLAGAVGAAEPVANGIFLIAKREMRDPRFQRTVLLITQPPQGGPFGVIINRPLRQPLSEVLPRAAALAGREDVLHVGGPVAPNGLLFLVRGARPPGRAAHVLDDVFFTFDAAWIEGLLKRAEPPRGLRVFAGYAGWAPGQLQNELKRGDWHVLPADADTIFEKDPARIWPELIERASLRPTRGYLHPRPLSRERGA